MIRTRKRQLRLLVSQQTALIPRAERLEQADRVFSRLEHMASFRKSANIGLFWSLSDEIPTQEFIAKWATRKNIYLPLIEGTQLHFVKFTPDCNMVQGGLRILVPEGTPRIEPGQLELVIVPGTAFDPYGGRLGRGQGYYDRFFEKTRASKIGICLSHQLVGEVPAESHDKKVDMVITPSGTFVSMEKAANEKANCPDKAGHDASLYETPA